MKQIPDHGPSSRAVQTTGLPNPTVPQLLAGLAAVAIAFAYAGTARAVPSWAGDPCTTQMHWENIGPTSGTTPAFQSSAAGCPAGPLTNEPFDASNSSPQGGFFQFRIPNFVDDLPMKKIWIMVQMIQDPFPAAFDNFFSSITAMDNNLGSNVDIERHSRDVEEVVGGQVWTVTEEWWLMPNPDYEDITLISEPIIQYPITDIWIHTISMDNDLPEPGTLAVFGVGLIGLAWTRRRRRR
jgi:hypothetical protein